MGVGKSLISKELSKKLNIELIDIDTEIVKKEGISINEIFKKKGELYFRNLETEILKNIRKEKIISCGGGLPIHNNNMQYIISNGISIYLKANSDILYSRLKKEKRNRPLINLKKENELKIFIKNEIKKREVFYKKATYIINTDNKAIKDILREICSFILPS